MGLSLSIQALGYPLLVIRFSRMSSGYEFVSRSTLVANSWKPRIMLMLWILIVSIRHGGLVVVLLASADFELCVELVICVPTLVRGRLEVLMYESNFHAERTACLFHLLFFWFLVEDLGNHFRCYFLHLLSDVIPAVPGIWASPHFLFVIWPISALNNWLTGSYFWCLLL